MKQATTIIEMQDNIFLANHAQRENIFAVLVNEDSNNVAAILKGKKVDGFLDNIRVAIISDGCFDELKTLEIGYDDHSELFTISGTAIMDGEESEFNYALNFQYCYE